VAGDIVVTLVGGSVEINDLTFTSQHDALPSLEFGREYLLLLTRRDGRYRVVGDYFGAFVIDDARLVPATRKSGFAREYTGIAADDAAKDLVARRRSAVQ
jgi:hypothetical protein